jgi:phosphoesterase RecJ-like protein
LKFDRAFIVDCGSLSRIGDVAQLLDEPRTIINVDHHVSNDNFGSTNIVDAHASAACEILYRACKYLEIHITPALATNLYAGILTDTGRFRYSSTTPGCLEAAADLARAGADVTRITNSLYFDLPEKDLRSMSRIYATLELFEDGKISTLFCRADNLVEDPDSIVDLALSIRGVEVAALMSEAGEKIRISLRSKHYVNVARIAESLGGGGHERAAGFRMQGTLESVRTRVLPILAAEVTQTQVPDAVAV